MRYLSYQDAYYESSADTLEYIIRKGDEEVFRGVARKAPDTEYAYINVGIICRQYLNNQLPDIETLTGEYVMENSNAVFDLYAVTMVREYTCPEEWLDLVEETLIDSFYFLENWDYNTELTGNTDIILSEPINGHADCRMKIIGTIAIESGNKYFQLLTDSLYFNSTGETKQIEWDTDLPPVSLTVTTSNSGFTVSNITQTGCDITAIFNLALSGNSATASIYYRDMLLGTVALTQGGLYFSLTTTALTFGSTGETMPICWTTDVPIELITVSANNSGFTASNISQTGCSITAIGNTELSSITASVYVYYNGIEVGTIAITQGGLHFIFLNDYIELDHQIETVPFDTDIDPSLLTITTDNTGFTISNITSTSCTVTSTVSASTVISAYYNGTLLDTVTVGYDLYLHMYLTVEMISGGTLILTYQRYNPNFPEQYVAYKKNNGNWVNVSASATTLSLVDGDIIRLKGSDILDKIISENGVYKVYGNIQSLYSGDNFASDNVAHYARDLFSINKNLTYHTYYSNCGLVEAKNLKLPGTVLPGTDHSFGQYNGMFEGCSHLETPPQILPYIVPDNTYEVAYTRMFKDCTSLKSAPQLPSDYVVSYAGMFKNCTSLEVAPALPATHIMYQAAYEEMFAGCTSLKTAPSVLPSSFAAYCRMFENCTSLEVAPEIQANSGDTQYMFAGCTSLITPPLYLHIGCWAMFSGCTSLEVSPVIDFSTIGAGGWGGFPMDYAFDGCTNLKTIICFATALINPDLAPTTNWVRGVSATGTFVKDPNATFWTYGTDGIPNGWTVIDFQN